MSAVTLEHVLATLRAVASATRATTAAGLIADVGEAVLSLPGVTASACYLRDTSEPVLQDYRLVDLDSVPPVSSEEIDEWTELHIVHHTNHTSTIEASPHAGNVLPVIMWIGVPLAGSERAHGVLLVRMENAGHDGSAQHVVLAALGLQIGIALEVIALRQEIERLSPIDRVTGAFSREHFDLVLHSEVERASRLRYPLGLLLLEPDAVEQTLFDRGQPALSSLLHGVAAAISPAIRSIDTVFRVDTTSFAVLLPGATASGLQGVGERLRLLLAQTSLKIGQTTQSTTLSLGGAVFPSDAYDAEELVEASRRALTTSQDSGRNRVTVLDDIR